MGFLQLFFKNEARADFAGKSEDGPTFVGFLDNRALLISKPT